MRVWFGVDPPVACVLGGGHVVEGLVGSVVDVLELPIVEEQLRFEEGY
jgi:hypothetical protein